MTGCGRSRGRRAEGEAAGAAGLLPRDDDGEADADDGGGGSTGGRRQLRPDRRSGRRGRWEGGGAAVQRGG
jgi:hypothetical protein